MMRSCDVVVVGAGPAGGACARALSGMGWSVILLEKARDFFAQDFSTGGAPLEILSDFDLPESVVGAYWNRIRIAASHEAQLWQKSNAPRENKEAQVVSSECPASEALGVVLDFQKLRSHLAEATEKNGSWVMMGARFLRSVLNSEDITIFYEKNKQQSSIRAKVLVDATGTERRVLMAGSPKNVNQRDKIIVGKGVEYLVEVSDALYDRYAACLSFFIGTQWMPQGYAWLFPMARPRLKIGVGRNFPELQAVPHDRSLRKALERLMQGCFLSEEAHILDRHGKTLTYRCAQKDIYVGPRQIAIGDAVSTVNPLTFEGIRHALRSGVLGAKTVGRFLCGEIGDLDAYRLEMRRPVLGGWAASEWLTQKIYREPDDQKLSLMLKALKGFRLEEINDLFFYYRFRTALKFYSRYQLLCLRHLLSAPFGGKLR